MIFSRQLTAQGAILANTAVKGGTADDTVAQATAVSDRLVGVYASGSDAVDGQVIDICMLGPCNMQIGGAVGRNAWLTIDSSGKGVASAPAAGTNNQIIGQAMIAASSGQTAEVFVQRWSYQG